MTPKLSGTALIIGASGFLGSHLAVASKRRYGELIGLDLNPPRDRSLWDAFIQTEASAVDFESLLASKRITHCFYLGGRASVPGSVAQPYGDFDALVPGIARLLDYLRSHQPAAHVIYFSSAAVYGQPRELPISEQHQVAPISPYGAHRHVVEVLLDHYARIFGLTASILRIFSAYGVYQRQLLFWDLLQKAHAAAEEGNALISAYGTGEETRDFVHAEDIAKAALLVADRPRSGQAQVINVASGEGVSIHQAASVVLAGLPRRIAVNFSGEVRKGVPTNWLADISRLKRMGYAPSRSLEDGLREYAAWFLTVIQEREKD